MAFRHAGSGTGSRQLGRFPGRSRRTAGTGTSCRGRRLGSEERSGPLGRSGRPESPELVYPGRADGNRLFQSLPGKRNEPGRPGARSGHARTISRAPGKPVRRSHSRESAGSCPGSGFGSVLRRLGQQPLGRTDPGKTQTAGRSSAGTASGSGTAAPARSSAGGRGLAGTASRK